MGRTSRIVSTPTRSKQTQLGTEHLTKMVAVSTDKVPLFLFTYNCGKNAPLSSAFTQEVSKLYDTKGELPHLFVYGFQELCSILDGTSPELVNSRLIQMADLLIDSLKSSYGDDYNFQTVAINHIGCIALVVISPFKSRVSNVRVATGPCGQYMTSLKGGCGIRVSYASREQSRRGVGSSQVNDPSTVDFTFVVAHLNAHEGYTRLQRRNKDLLTLFQGLDFEDGHSILKSGSHCFFMGDLNYRATGVGGTGNTELARLLETHDNDFDADDDVTRDDDGVGEESRITSMVTNKDELTILRNKGEVLWGFDEAEIKFKPTYKFKVGTLNYNYKRTPSWCDRILYQGYESDDELTRKDTQGVKVIKYQSADNFLFSDHIPVYLSIEVPFKSPSPVIADSGYLIENYGIVSGDIYLKPTKMMKFYKNVGFFTDYALGSALFVATTKQGRLYLVVILFVIYLVYKTIG